MRLYIWSDSTVVIDLIGYWSPFENFFSYFDYPVGYYTLIPHLLKSDWYIGQWWKMPKSLERFLPSNQFTNSNYLHHPKKFDTPTIYLDSIQTKK